MYLFKIDIFVIRNRYIFLKTNVFLQNCYFCNPKQVYISENQCISSKIDSFVIRNRYIFLKSNLFLQNCYFCNPKQVYISEKQSIPSKLIFLLSETGIYF